MLYRKFAAAAFAVPAAFVALTTGNASQPPRPAPSAAAIERAVARAHDIAERAGGRPGKLQLALPGGA